MIKTFRLSHKSIFIFILWATIGVICTIGINQYNPLQDNNIDYSVRQSGYNFINPLLECEIQNHWDRQKYIPFETNTINRIKKEIIETHPEMTIGIYVRNLNNGPWFGINENEKYSPASMMKVPILITFLKWIEQDSSVLDKKIFISKDSTSLNQYFKPLTDIIVWKEYNVAELLKEMIINSNNLAMNTLLEIMPPQLYVQVSNNLKIIVPKYETEENYLSVKDMASFFRILYNASYLNRDSSEYALNLLSKVTFDKGLRAWVPSNILVSHKFGERGYTDEWWKQIRQLHDCGIVYYPKYPYLLCIVSKWDNFDTNANIIMNTSKIVFEEISKTYPQK